jgi:hypothetical protein
MTKLNRRRRSAVPTRWRALGGALLASMSRSLKGYDKRTAVFHARVITSSVEYGAGERVIKGTGLSGARVL